ncbi:MAG: hypothetical protein U0229_22125 [Anaeromyxobacter sp.]
MPRPDDKQAQVPSAAPARRPVRYEPPRVLERRAVERVTFSVAGQIDNGGSIGDQNP